MQIKKIIELGILIEPTVAKELNLMPEIQFNTLISKLTTLDAKPMVLDAEMVKRLTAVPAKLVKQVQPRKEFSMPELVSAWNNRFSILQKALMRRPELSNPVSIKNANGRCTVIGTVNVRDKIFIEDPTGAIELRAPSNIRVFTDDVVGIVGTVLHGAMSAEEIFFPDVPMQQPKQIECTISICPANITMQSDFVLEAKENEIDWFDCNGISVMTAKISEQDKKKFGASENAAIEILKRRTLGTAPFDVIEPVPDVLFIQGAENFVSHHKGTTVVGFSKAARINMRDRSVEFGE